MSTTFNTQDFSNMFWLNRLYTGEMIKFRQQIQTGLCAECPIASSENCKECPIAKLEDDITALVSVRQEAERKNGGK